MTAPGSLGLFSGLTLLAWVLVYFLVEETRELSLENLHDVFSVPKRDFVRLKYRRLVYLGRRYLLRDTRAQDPSAVQEDENEGASMSIVMDDYAISAGRGSAEMGQGGGSMVASRPGSHVEPHASAGLVHRDERER